MECAKKYFARGAQAVVKDVHRMEPYDLLVTTTGTELIEVKGASTHGVPFHVATSRWIGLVAKGAAATLFGHSGLLIQRLRSASRAFENAPSSASSKTKRPSRAAAAWESLFFNCFVGLESSVA